MHYQQERSEKKELDSRLRGNDETEEQELDCTQLLPHACRPFAARMFASASWYAVPPTLKWR